MFIHNNIMFRNTIFHNFYSTYLSYFLYIDTLELVKSEQCSLLRILESTSFFLVKLSKEIIISLSLPRTFAS